MSEVRLYSAPDLLPNWAGIGVPYPYQCTVRYNPVNRTTEMKAPEQAAGLPPRLSHDSTPDERNDRARVFSLCVGNGGQFRYASKLLRGDREFIMQILRHTSLIRSRRVWELLQHADGDALRDDRELVEAAVSNNFLALQFASPRLKADPALVLCAMAQDAFALAWASASLRTDLDFIAAAAKYDARVLQWCDRTAISTLDDNDDNAEKKKKQEEQEQEEADEDGKTKNDLKLDCLSAAVRHNHHCWPLLSEGQRRNKRLISACASGSHPKPKVFLAMANRALKEWQKKAAMDLKRKQEEAYRRRSVNKIKGGSTE